MSETLLKYLGGNEYYIAPTYNQLFEVGGSVRLSIIDKFDVIFCGAPPEYNDLISSPNSEIEFFKKSYLKVMY